MNGQRNHNLFARTNTRMREERKGGKGGRDSQNINRLNIPQQDLPLPQRSANKLWRLEPCVHGDSEPWQHVTVQVCYNQRKVTVKDPDKPLPSYVGLQVSPLQTVGAQKRGPGDL